MDWLTQIPPKVRRVAYVVSGALLFAASLTQLGYLTANTGDPLWLKIAIAVVGVLSTALHGTAAANVAVSKARRAVR